jgi:hypothetical protein
MPSDPSDPTLRALIERWKREIEAVNAGEANEFSAWQKERQKWMPFAGGGSGNDAGSSGDGCGDGCGGGDGGGGGD